MLIFGVNRWNHLDFCAEVSRNGVVEWVSGSVSSDPTMDRNLSDAWHGVAAVLREAIQENYGVDVEIDFASAECRK